MYPVLNGGFVKLLETLGGDGAVIRNARLCWRSESKSKEADARLIRHLLKEGHKTPFEAMVFSFEVKAPLFVARQWFRHRMASYNEESLRYCTALREYYIPETIGGEQKEKWLQYHQDAFAYYEQLVAAGMHKEQARSVLPMGIYTHYYWTVNGSSLLNFLNLRLDRHAQWETRQYAQAILELAEPEAPLCFAAFKELWEQRHDTN